MRYESARLLLNLPLLIDCSSYVVSPIPPWLNLNFEVYEDLCVEMSRIAPSNVLKRVAELTINNRFSEYIKIFTDGSKSTVGGEVRAGGAFYIPHIDFTLRFRIADLHFVITTELFAIQSSLTWILNSLAPCRIVILSDSKSALLSLKSVSCRVQDIVYA